MSASFPHVARPTIVRAENDLLFDAEGRRYVDLFSGHGVVWLGHADPEIVARVSDQLSRVWAAPGLLTPAAAEARAAVERWFPGSHGLAALYSTGMEAAEFAIRFARGATGRRAVVGFARSMHGKSVATARLGWPGGEGGELPDVVRLPLPPDCSEAETSRLLEARLAAGGVAAVFVEPIQGSGGGHEASAGFHREVSALCREAGALLVFDEILTGFHRTGPPFFFSELGFVPDVILIGKALGNGFPVSGVVADRRHPVRPDMLPGSTFAGNPLAAAAVAATLHRMESLDLPRRVAAIGACVAKVTEPLRAAGVVVRGRGALWVIEVPAVDDLIGVVVAAHARGVSVGHTGRLLRILPPATIEPAHLETACTVLVEEVLRALPAGRTP
jgi:4-aminobutyrate aminotransferase-like enzyme